MSPKSNVRDKDRDKDKDKENEKECLRSVEISDLTDEDSTGCARWTASNNLTHSNRISPTNGISLMSPYLPPPGGLSTTQRNSAMIQPLFRPALTAALSLASPLSTTTSSSSSSFIASQPQHLGPSLSPGGGISRGESDKNRPGTAWVTPQTPLITLIPVNSRSSSIIAIGSSSSSSRTAHDSKSGSCASLDCEVEIPASQRPEMLDDDDDDDDDDQSILVHTNCATRCYLFYFFALSFLDGYAIWSDHVSANTCSLFNIFSPLLISPVLASFLTLSWSIPPPPPPPPPPLHISLECWVQQLIHFGSWQREDW